MRYYTLPVTAFEQNCTLMHCTKSNQAALFDPGGDADKLIKAVADSGATMEAIYLTHAHLDHVGAAKTLATHYGVPIIGPEQQDRFLLQNLPQQAQMFQFPPCEAFEPDRWLQAGDTVSVGELQFEVLHCPGHSPGHVVFHHAEQALAISGDVLFRGGIGRTDLPGGSSEALLHSIRHTLFALSPETTLLPGHGPHTTLQHERQTNPFVSDARFASRH